MKSNIYNIYTTRGNIIARQVQSINKNTITSLSKAPYKYNNTAQQRKTVVADFQRETKQSMDNVESSKSIERKKRYHWRPEFSEIHHKWCRRSIAMSLEIVNQSRPRLEWKGSTSSTSPTRVKVGKLVMAVVSAADRTLVRLASVALYIVIA